jgi:hypothetical protein
MWIRETLVQKLHFVVTTKQNAFFVYFFGGLERFGHSFPHVVHFEFLEMSGFEP